MDWNKILRYLSGDCTPDEEIEITEWMSLSPENEELIMFLETIWQMKPAEQKKINEESAWENFNQKFRLDNDVKGDSRNIADEDEEFPLLKTKEFNRKSMTGFRTIAFAATLLIAAFLSFQFFEDMVTDEPVASGEEIEYREIRTERGERSKITLSDGSIIHLNGESFLKIPRVSNGPERTVFLEGEAFFEINRNEDSQFRVVVDETVTTVLGTRFNVRSYYEEQDVTVVVADGTVSINYLDNPSDEQAILTKNQKGVIGNGLSPQISEVNDLTVYHGWIQGELIFVQEPLPQIITKLERWFGIDIEIETDHYSDELDEKRITASFSERQPVDDVLQSISLALDLSIEKTNTSETRYKLFNQ